MSEATETIVYVCNTCRPDDFAGEDDERPGAIFWRQLAERVKERELTGKVTVKAVECLSVCKRPCTVAVSGGGKFTYVVGDLETETDVDPIIDFAVVYGEAPDGITVWRDRPQKVRKHTVARVPAFGHQKAPVLDIEPG